MPRALDARAQSSVISAYIGFDATADSLHVGSLVQIMLLRRLQQAGHRPIVLMGGGTTKVGDPRAATRRVSCSPRQQIDANIAGIRDIFARFLRLRRQPRRAPSWSITTIGCKPASTSTSCATSAGTSRSIACSPWTA